MNEDSPSPGRLRRSSASKFCPLGRELHLSMMMRLAVPLHIEMLQARGGPTADDMKKAQATSDILGEHGDILLHGGGKQGECANIFNRTAHAVAVLAFVPGGVELFGARFEAGKTAGNGERSRDAQAA